MAYVIREAEHVAWVAGKFEIDASHASTQGNDAKCAYDKNHTVKNILMGEKKKELEKGNDIRTDVQSF